MYQKEGGIRQVVGKNSGIYDPQRNFDIDEGFI